MRVLVAIANHGTKNQRFLNELLASYRSMRFEVSIVVISDQPKELGSDVEVVVGAPTSDPWSLPFRHRELFAASVDEFDLFIYTEDDTLITEAHLDAFLDADELLSDDEVPGFLRFEIYPDGRRSYCSIHSSYRWDPATVTARGGEVFASYTNQHSACYILTRDQLARAICSGGFLVEPHQGAYDMLVTAATDPYTRCGLTRRICISRIDEFLLHHLPNVYLGKLGIEEAEFRSQQQALLDIAHAGRTSRSLLDPTSALATPAWDVPQHPRHLVGLQELVGAPRTALSVGCTSGALERELFGPDVAVTAIPIDEVVGAVAGSRGLEVLVPDLSDSLRSLGDRRFDRVLLHQVLHHFSDPVAVLEALRSRLEPTGEVLVAVPNVSYQRLRKLARRRGVPPLPGTGLAVDRVHATTNRSVRRWLRAAGFEVLELRTERTQAVSRVSRFVPRRLDPLLGAVICFRARPAP